MMPNPYWAPSLRDMIPLLLRDFVVVLGIALLVLITIGAFTNYQNCIWKWMAQT